MIQYLRRGDHAIIRFSILAALSLVLGCPQTNLAEQIDDRPAAELPDNTDIFVDVNRDHDFDAGTDIPIYDAFLASGVASRGVFDTSIERVGYTPPPGTVDIVLAAKPGGRSSLKVPADVDSLSLKASGNIVILASIAGLTPGALAFDAESGFIEIGPDVSIDASNGGIDLSAGTYVSMATRSSLMALGVSGYARITSDGISTPVELTNAKIRAQNGVRIIAGCVDIAESSITAFGEFAANAPNEFFDVAPMYIYTTRYLHIDDSELKSKQDLSAPVYAEKPAIKLKTFYDLGAGTQASDNLSLSHSEMTGFVRIETSISAPAPTITADQFDLNPGYATFTN